MAHTTSGRTEARDDGMVKAWYTVDGEEFWLGFFADATLAQNEIDNMILSAEARFLDEATPKAEAG